MEPDSVPLEAVLVLGSPMRDTFLDGLTLGVGTDPLLEETKDLPII